MGKVVLDVAMSPDGFTAGPDVGEDLLGDNGGTFAFDGLEAAARRARDAAGERGELILEGKPVTGAVTHLRYRVAKPRRP